MKGVELRSFSLLSKGLPTLTFMNCAFACISGERESLMGSGTEEGAVSQQGAVLGIISSARKALVDVGATGLEHWVQGSGKPRVG